MNTVINLSMLNHTIRYEPLYSIIAPYVTPMLAFLLILQEIHIQIIDCLRKLSVLAAVKQTAYVHSGEYFIPTRS